ncbi:hypothetical protein E3U47_00635 [Pseudomonas sp. RIT623]|nr:hypothetical protein E3U47_00635 [Pseudomonas sp. RIT623]
MAGAAAQPFRDTRPLLQGYAIPCRSGLVSRKGRKAAPWPSRSIKKGMKPALFFACTVSPFPVFM